MWERKLKTKIYKGKQEQEICTKMLVIEIVEKKKQAEKEDRQRIEKASHWNFVKRRKEKEKKDA